MKPRPADDEVGVPTDAERAARQAFEALRGVPFTDGEWREAERNLTELLAIGVRWTLDAMRSERAAADRAEPIAVAASEVARLLSIKRDQVYKLHHAGILNGFRVHPKSHLKFLVSEVREVAKRMSDERRDA